MGRHATFGFPEGKRRSPELGRFRMGELVRAHLRPPHPRPFAVPRPQRQGRCGIKPGVAPPRRYPGSRPHRVPYPARGCAVRARRGVRETRAECDRVLGCGRGVPPECMSTIHAIHTHHMPPVRTIGTTPLGLFMSLAFTRGSASAAQPRALWQNPVGIPGGRMPAHTTP